MSRARFLHNPMVSGALSDEGPRPDALRFHARLPGYAPTPLVSLPDLADTLGVAAVLAKDETSRLGLPAFKVLGASWALHNSLARRGGFDLDGWETLEDLRRLVAPLLPLEVVTATDGNHGRSVAHVARLLGLGARVFVPAGTAAARIEAIESEGARVEVVDGTYDDTVLRAAGAETEATFLVQDTSWPGYEEVPAWIVEGYETLFAEIDASLEARGEPGPDVVLLPIGVGSLAEAAVRHYRRPGLARPPRLVGVEPVGAACALASLRAGRPVTLPGSPRSLMAGLNCGTVSTLAFPWLQRGLSGVVVVEDARAEDAVRRLVTLGIPAGESGAAATAGLLEIALNESEELERPRRWLGPRTRVLVLVTEGITDPDTHVRTLARV